MKRSGVLLVAWLAWLAASACSSPGVKTRIELKDGTVIVADVVQARADALVVRTADGKELTVARTDIASLGTAAEGDSASTGGGENADAGSSADRGGASEGSPGGAPDGGTGAGRGGSTGAGDRTGGGGSRPDPEGRTSGAVVVDNGASREAEGRSADRGADDRTGSTGAGGRYRQVTVPAGTLVSIVLATTVASNTSHVEDSVRGRLAEPVVVDGVVVFARQATVTGSVIEAAASGRVKGRARIAIRFERIESADEVSHDVKTAPIAREAEATKKEDATKVGIGAAAGAVIGGIVGGRRGAGTGAAAGAGAGTAVVLSTKGEEVTLASGTKVQTRLLSPLRLQVPMESGTDGARE